MHKKTGQEQQSFNPMLVVIINTVQFPEIFLLLLLFSEQFPQVQYNHSYYFSFIQLQLSTSTKYLEKTCGHYQFVARSISISLPVGGCFSLSIGFFMH